MTKFEEHTKFAQRILSIRTMMEDMLPVFFISNDGDGDGDDYYHYSMQFDGGNLYTVGYLHKTRDVKQISCYSHFLIHDKTCDWFSTGRDRYKIDCNTDEDWHFQQSLIYNDAVLKQMLLFNTLKKEESHYQYFQLNVNNAHLFFKGLYDD